LKDCDDDASDRTKTDGNLGSNSVRGDTDIKTARHGSKEFDFFSMAIDEKKNAFKKELPYSSSRMGLYFKSSFKIP